MKNSILATLRAVFRPLAAKLFPEQFKERTLEEVELPALNLAAVKERMVAAMAKQRPLDRLDATHSEAEIREAIGYNRAVRDMSKLWEVALHGRS